MTLHHAMHGRIIDEELKTQALTNGWAWDHGTTNIDDPIKDSLNEMIDLRTTNG